MHIFIYLVFIMKTAFQKNYTNLYYQLLGSLSIQQLKNYKSQLLIHIPLIMTEAEHTSCLSAVCISHSH